MVERALLCFSTLKMSVILTSSSLSSAAWYFSFIIRIPARERTASITTITVTTMPKEVCRLFTDSLTPFTIPIIPAVAMPIIMDTILGPIISFER